LSKQPDCFFVPFGLSSMYSCCYSLLVPSWCSFFSLQLNAVAVLPVVSTCLGCVYSLSLVSCLVWFQGSLSPTNQVYCCSWTVPSHCCALSHDTMILGSLPVVSQTSDAKSRLHSFQIVCLPYFIIPYTRTDADSTHTNRPGILYYATRKVVRSAYGKMHVVP
jgi:hypothetical protein